MPFPSGSKALGGFLLLMLARCGIAVAQDQDLSKLSREKYVERFTEYFFVWPVVKQRTTSFTIQSLQNSSQKLVYRPNVQYHAGAGVYMFGLGLQLVLALPSSSASNDRYGKSHALDLQGNILGENWGFDIFSQRYSGYYLSDPSKPVASNAAYPRREDVHTWNTGVTGIYFFDKQRFSIRSTYNYYERQLKSSGSFLLSGNLTTFTLHADSSIYGPSYEGEFGANGDFTRVTYTTAAIAPGYAHNFIFDNFFVGASAAVGPGINWIYYQLGTAPEKSAVQLNTFFDVRLAAGYNGERFFAGVTYTWLVRNIAYEGIRFTNSNESVKFTVGYRFKQVGILKKNIMDLIRPKVSG